MRQLITRRGDFGMGDSSAATSSPPSNADSGAPVPLNNYTTMPVNPNAPMAPYYYVPPAPDPAQLAAEAQKMVPQQIAPNGAVMAPLPIVVAAPPMPVPVDPSQYSPIAAYPNGASVPTAPTAQEAAVVAAATPAAPLVNVPAVLASAGLALLFKWIFS